MFELENDLENSLTTLTNTLQIYHMKINARKTKEMIVTKTEVVPLVRLWIDNYSIEQFKYLGSMLNSDEICSIEIRRWIAMEKKEMKRMSELVELKWKVT